MTIQSQVLQREYSVSHPEHAVTLSGKIRNVVGMGQALWAQDENVIIVTHALGSCLGITLYDPVARVGGLFHPMLPVSSVNPEKAEKQPFVFVDKGFPLFLSKVESLGASRRRLILKVAGGAKMYGKGKDDFFDIGNRNYMAFRELINLYGVNVAAEDVGGHVSRTLYLHLDNGQTEVLAKGAVSVL